MSPRVRCAIYTRKSTEEGLEQDFNSLDAQREACEAYIKSQRSLGWSGLATQYNDGGISGGTLERPALKRLLADIDAGTVDLVVVYKVDRLTRSLADFAKIVERFEARGASFVSVTQQFNTSTSMGRLTLNVLLSFAQFEREVTGERIRDKIAASKRKGMWMGGQIPLGYDLHERKLMTNSVEAAQVKAIFRRYLALGSVDALVSELSRQRVVTKMRTSRNGRSSGGRPFSRGHLYQILSNRLYIGEVAHKGQNYKGEHKSIIDRELFDEVQQRLTENAKARRTASNAISEHSLTGLIYDEAGERLCPTHTNKKGKRYGYYISKRLVHRRDEHGSGWRLPSQQLDRIVIQGLITFLRDKSQLIGAMEQLPLRPAQLQRAMKLAFDAADQTNNRIDLDRLLERVTVKTGCISISIKRARLFALIDLPTAELRDDDFISVIVPINLHRRGGAKLIVAANSDAHQDASLVLTIAKAKSWWNDLMTGGVSSIEDIAAKEKLDAADVTRSLPLAFLAPSIIQTIIDGRQPTPLTTYNLKRLKLLPHSWSDQRTMLGFVS